VIYLIFELHSSRAIQNIISIGLSKSRLRFTNLRNLATVFASTWRRAEGGNEKELRFDTNDGVARQTAPRLDSAPKEFVGLAEAVHSAIKNVKLFCSPPSSSQSAVLQSYAQFNPYIAKFALSIFLRVSFFIC